MINTSRPVQNIHHCADDILKYIFFNKNIVKNMSKKKKKRIHNS